MTEKFIRFRRHYGVRPVPEVGVLVASRDRHTVLRGKLGVRIAALIDGRHTRSEIVIALADEFSASTVDQGLAGLVDAGLVVEADAEPDPRTTGFWELSGLDPALADNAIRRQGVNVLAVGSASPELLTTAAAAMDLNLASPQPALTVVLTDDPLHPDLRDINARAIAEQRPWLVAKLTGDVAWIGPVFEPGRTACWQCLAQRAIGHRPVEEILQRVTGREYVPPLAGTADLPVTVELAARLAVLRVVTWLAGGRDEFDHVLTFDTVTLESRKHRLTPRPQCPACGDSTLQATLTQRPVVFQDRHKGSDTDGGYRTSGQEEMLAEYGPLISPVTGVVSELVKIDTRSDLLHVYTAGNNFALDKPSTLKPAHRGLRASSSGKGMSDRQARASALGEAIERYSGVWQGDEAYLTESYRALGTAAIHPGLLQHFSQRQFRERELFNERGDSYNWVPEPFDEERTLAWTPVWSLTEKRHKYVPTSYLYYGIPAHDGPVFCRANSNGSAAGSSLEDAVLQGFFELVERDSVAIWWYNRLRRPAVSLDSFSIPYFERWQREYTALGRQSWVLDLTSDLGIPVAAAVSRRGDHPSEDILLGFGAHFDPAIAVSRALSEMNQFLTGLPAICSDEISGFNGHKQWWRTATVANQTYLAPLGHSDYGHASGALPARDTTLLEDLRRAQNIIEDRGMELLVLDQTRPDIGLPVAKVMVPGLRHFWAQYGPGRLYDVPVELGWLAAPNREDDLNPVAVFI